MRVLLLAVTSFLLAGCMTSPPTKPNDICAMFKEKKGWYKEAKASQDKWGSSIPVMMATMHQESRFVADARPPRSKILGFIPGPRPSDAYGYPQALNGTWNGYRKATSSWGADRDDFGDAIDFIGWYFDQSYKRNRIAKNDAYNLYLTYHEGHGGYSRQTYASKTWLKNVAQKVATQSRTYEGQLKACEKDLTKSRFWLF